ncbi:hypothetical protein DQ04_18021020 [Trypanosoma grayi]|uniref:hypothetical protein n=1 Tax=Trypanosoma grayi TaxID=71804 RepID=UPI0004F3FF11|nr:hypothetical protein DQ04_18021020 [Trypanosoma grayi]KEG05838.1 hypothetical protein DQ04_18021020 [Trypanosoma grayi]
MVSFNMPKNENLLKAFDDARTTFRTEWMALEESRSILYQQYEMARAKLADENLKIQQEAYAQTVVSHDCINQMQHQINTLQSQKTSCTRRTTRCSRGLSKKKKKGLPAQRAATEGRNDLIPPGVHTVAHTAKMGGHAKRLFALSGA